MQREIVRTAIGLALAAGAAATGSAQHDGGEPAGADVVDLYDDARADVIPLAEWRQEELYEGWSADALLGMPVHGPRGDEIGEVKNLLIGRAGSIVALIAEVGGFADLGDTHVAIPWDQVARRDDAVVIPLTEDTVAEYGLFEESFFSLLDQGDVDAVAEDVRTGPSIWKVTELLDDYAIVEPNEPYGYVSDLVFDDAGELKAVIVNAANADVGNLGDYAYPWYGYEHGWRPQHPAYQVPYTREEIAGLTAFDYDQFEDESNL